jgi:hypothetical protein
MRPAKYFYDKPLPKNIDAKTVLIYFPRPVQLKTCVTSSPLLILMNVQKSILLLLHEKNKKEEFFPHLSLAAKQYRQ